MSLISLTGKTISKIIYTFERPSSIVVKSSLHVRGVAGSKSKKCSINLVWIKALDSVTILVIGMSINDLSQE